MNLLSYAVICQFSSTRPICTSSTTRHSDAVLGTAIWSCRFRTKSNLFRNYSMEVCESHLGPPSSLFAAFTAASAWQPRHTAISVRYTVVVWPEHPCFVVVMVVVMIILMSFRSLLYMLKKPRKMPTISVQPAREAAASFCVVAYLFGQLRLIQAC